MMTNMMIIIMITMKVKIMMVMIFPKGEPHSSHSYLKKLLTDSAHTISCIISLLSFILITAHATPE